MVGIGAEMREHCYVCIDFVSDSFPAGTVEIKIHISGFYAVFAKVPYFIENRVG